MPHAHHAGVSPSHIALTVGLFFSAFWYAIGWIRRRSRDDTERWRIGSFLLGLLLIWLAIGSPVAALDHQLLTVHMIQHLLLMTIAPPLILLGTPVRQGWKSLRSAPVIDRVKTSSFFERLGAIMLHPTVCWLASISTLVLWHIPSIFMLGMRSELSHGFEQATFLITGLLFWWPVIYSETSARNRSEWLILLYLFLATLPCDILSGFLVFCDRVVYPAYLSSPGHAGFSALEDQQCAGALMWTCVTIVYLIAGTVLALNLLSPENQKSRNFQPATSH